MSNSVLSVQNRFYAEVEPAFGQVPAIAAANRFSAVKLGAKQSDEQRDRKDKTGSRTYVGVTPGGRRRTQFSLLSYLLAGTTPGTEPAVGKLFHGVLGNGPLAFGGGTAGSGSTSTQIVFSAAHGLSVGQAFASSDELRFVATVNSPTSVTVNAPFSAAPAAGALLKGAVTYTPATEIPSLSIFDYWTPSTAVSRVLAGAVCGKLQVKINGDFHEFEFSGEGQDIIDSASFTSGQGGLSSFPAEPAINWTPEPAVPGNLGQAWLGASASRFMTVTRGTVTLDNDIDMRGQEFGSRVPLFHSPGMRKVTADIELFELDDAATQGLYQSARAQTPIQVVIQLGQTSGALFGVCMKAVIPKVPQFDDKERTLAWSFSGCRAQGLADDEIYVALG